MINNLSYPSYNFAGPTTKLKLRQKVKEFTLNDDHKAWATITSPTKKDELPEIFWEIQLYGDSRRPCTLQEVICFEQMTSSEDERFLFPVREGRFLIDTFKDGEEGWIPIVPTLYEFLLSCSKKKREEVASRLQKRWGCPPGYTPSPYEKPTMDFIHKLVEFILDFNPENQEYESRVDGLIQNFRDYFPGSNDGELSSNILDMIGRKDSSSVRLRHANDWDFLLPPDVRERKYQKYREECGIED